MQQKVAIAPELELLTKFVGIVFWGLDHSCLGGLSVALGVA